MLFCNAAYAAKPAMRKQKPQFPGLCRFARLLGVTPTHLLRVARGERQSPELLAQFQAMMAAENAGKNGVAILPAGTRLVDCTEQQRQKATEEFGSRVSIEGGDIVLHADFQMTFTRTETTVSPLPTRRRIKRKTNPETAAPAPAPAP